MVVMMVVVMEEEEETISTLSKTEAWLSVNQTLCLTTHSSVGRYICCPREPMLDV